MLTISLVLLAVHALGALAAPSAANGLRIPINKRQLAISVNGTVDLDALDQLLVFLEASVSTSRSLLSAYLFSSAMRRP